MLQWPEYYHYSMSLKATDCRKKDDFLETHFESILGSKTSSVPAQ